MIEMTPLSEILEKPKLVRRNGFDRVDTKFLLQIPKDERTPGLIEQLIKRHTPLAVSVAKKVWRKYSYFAGAALEFEDVLTSAMCGLLIGINRFDYHYNNEFSTYVIHWIRQAAIREIANNIGLARIPIHYQEKIRRSWHKQQSVANGNAGTLLVVHQFFSNASLDTPISAGEDLTLINKVTSDCSLNLPKVPMSDRPDVIALKNDLRRRIEKSFSVMANQRDREVIQMRFGVNEYDEDHTLEEVGEHFGITRERVRQIVARYVKKVTLEGLFDEDDLAIFRGEQ